MLTLHWRLSPVLYTRWVLNTQQLSTHWRLEQTYKNHFLHLTTHLPFLNYSASVKEERQLATYSKNKCKYSSPFIWLSPTTPPIFFSGRVSVLSFTLKAIHLPQDKGFPLSRWKQMLGLREKAIIPRHNDTSQALTAVCITRHFFFSGKEATIQESMQKSLSEGCSSKAPSVTPLPHPAPPGMTTCRLNHSSGCLQQGFCLASAAAL